MRSLVIWPPALLLFLRDIRRCSVAQLIRRDHGHFLPTGGNGDFRYFDDLAVTLLCLLDRAVMNLLQRQSCKSTLP